DISLSQLPKKQLITFSQDSTVGDVLNLMLEKNIRRLMLEDSNKFINDRIILQKITDELKCLKETENFLELPIKDFKVEEATSISSDMKINELSKIMYEMEHPCVISDGKIITPWDICVILLSEQMTI
ncbi:MAG: CBS domain-containing protein, partial [Nitrosopumilaceae archaeon]